MAIKTKRMLSKTKSCSCSMPGVWRAAAYCSGAAVIFHSPRACAHVARSMDISAQYRALANGAAEKEVVSLIIQAVPEVRVLKVQLQFVF